MSKIEEDKKDNKPGLVRCQFICKKKKRKCKLLAKKNTDFCGEHMTYTEENEKQTDENLKRIVCPLDPKHSIYLKDLEKHKKKCNSREIVLGKFYVKDVNTLSSDIDDSDVGMTLEEMEKFTIKDLSEDELKKSIDYLLELDNKLNLSKELEMFEYQDDYVNQKLSNYHGLSSIKHLRQISSIVSHIKRVDVPNDKGSDNSVCFIELGAGRGKLTYWLSLAINRGNARYLLIERGSQRHKYDNFNNFDDEQKEKEVTIKFERIRMDIKNLYLSELDSIKETSRFILYGKHLCGAATDFTLHCINRTIKKEDKENKFKGLLLALCCHHRCDWSTFCGKSYFKSLNLNAKWFYIIRNLTSWATCGQRKTTDGDNNSATDDSYLQKEKIGRICKNLIDLARIKYITNLKVDNKQLLDAKIFYYCDDSVTLENRMLFVTPLS